MSLNAKHINNAMTWALLLWTFLLILTIWILCPTSQDESRYKELVAFAQSSAENQPHNSLHRRQGVRKDVFLNNGFMRQHIILTCKSSNMCFHEEGDKSSVVEEMHDVVSFMQEECFYRMPDGREFFKNDEGSYTMRAGKSADEELDPALLKPFQIIRKLEASEGRYNYLEDRFYADNAKISRFLVPGHRFVTEFSESEQLMEGQAKSVIFSLMSKEPYFKAYRLKARVSHPRGLE